jgi:NADH-quinone oxidoreductase subunit N
MNTFFLTDLVTPDANVSIILPELVVAFAGIVVMIYDSFFPKDRVTSGIISLAGLAVSALLLVGLWSSAPLGSTSWNGMIAHDNLRLGFSIVFLIVTAMTILISTVWVEREDVPVGEYNALLMFATFGMMLMAAGNDLVVIFLGLATHSIATHVMAGLRRGD